MAKSKSKEKKIQSIEDLPGIGPTTAAKLRENGFNTLESIATAPIGELSDLAGLGEKTAAKIIEMAREALDLSFEPASKVLERRTNLKKISTGANALDDLFGGGIETGAITEFFGEFRSGKTQIAHQLCVNSQLPVEQGGLKDGDKEVLVAYIDTEGTFRPERIVSMTKRYSELDAKKVLENIRVGRAYNSDHQIVLAEKLLREIATENYGLVIVDSLTSHFRAEFVGRGTLASRQQKLNSHIHSLLRLAELGNLAVVVTNQVQAKPDVFFGDPTAPIGGHIVAHACTTRTYLRKSKGDRRIARIVDSPLLPENEAVFAITELGIVDVK